MLGFESIGSAILIAYDGCPILTTDAWINDSAYFGSWTHDYAIPPQQMDAIRRAQFHWFSHGHPDHLNIESLPFLTRGQFLLSDHFGARIKTDIEALGYRVRILKDRRWEQLSKRVRIYSIANQNQDAILLIDVGGTLVINANDSPDYGASFHVRRIAKNYKNVFYCGLHGWGGADMMNVFDSDGHKLVDPKQKQRPIAPRAQRAAMVYGAHYAIPFSSFHIYQREDSAWANDLIPTLQDYQSHASSVGPTMLPAFVRVSAANGDISRLDPPRNIVNIRPPEAFGDSWHDRMTAEDAQRIDAYFKRQQHLSDSFGFIEVKLGGRNHIVDLNRRERNRGISFEAPRNSFMTCLQYQTFDDLLIGNFMKTTLHGVEALYPDFSPYVAKYGDNGGAKSRAELRRYFLHYFLRDPLGSILQKVSTNSEHIMRAIVPAHSGLFRVAKRVYYSVGTRHLEQQNKRTW